MYKMNNYNNQTPKPFSIWQTICYSFVIMCYIIISMVFSTIIYYLITHICGLEFNIDNLDSNGLFKFLSTLLYTVIGTLIIVKLIKRCKGWTVKKYLGLNIPKFKLVLFWCVIVVLIFVAETIIEYYFQIPDCNEEWKGMQYFPFAVISTTILTPIIEEIFFRGFIFRRIWNSKLGLIGAIIIPSLIWTFCHWRYPLIIKMMLFASGILFGIARIHTKSIYTPIIMHILWNSMCLIYIAIS